MAEPMFIITGGTVIDATGERRADVLVSEGLVREVADGLDVPLGATVLDAGGCVVAPGLVDLHTHLREPGTRGGRDGGDRARGPPRSGGYTAVVAMPNTEPPLDTAAAVRQVLELGRSASAQVAVAGAITVGRAGERLAPMAELAELGVRLFTDDGAGVQSAGLMRKALEYARGIGVTLAQHCEDGSLAGDGAMHEGAWSSRLGIPGMPAAAEEVMVARDIALSRLTGAPVHFLHLSTAASIDLVRRAKADGLAVTAEAAPHHFTLTDAETAGYDPVFKVNPPLRPQLRRRRSPGRTGRRRHRRHRHRSRPPHTRDQGPALRPGASGHARPGDGAGPGLDRARAAAVPGARPPQLAAGGHRRPDRGPRRAGRPRGGGQPVRDRPHRDLDGRPHRPGQPQPEHARTPAGP